MSNGDHRTIKSSYLSSEQQHSLEDRRSEYFLNSLGTPSEKMASLPRFMSRQNCAKFIAQYEMMKMTENVLGSILECGVYFGGGLMTWSLIGASLEPYNYQSQVIGFDTFEGTKGITDIDYQNKHFKRKEGEYYAPCFEDLNEAIKLYDQDRPLNHLPRTMLVKGDLRKTANKFVEEHPELAVRIIHIGVNIYEPTLAALKAFVPRLAKGGIISIDGLGFASGGCMQAIREVFGSSKIDFKVFDYYPNFTYFSAP